MNALADDKVAEYINENYTATYLKVGTFRIVGDAKVGGNVASYFCMPDGAVLHAVAGKVDAATLLREARWAYELRKAVLTFATDLTKGMTDGNKARALIRTAHAERYQAEMTAGMGGNIRVRGFFGGSATLRPVSFPTRISNQAQVHSLLSNQPLPKMATFYPIVWQRVLREKLSTLPVAGK